MLPPPPNHADLVIVCALEQPELEHLRRTNGGKWRQIPPTPSDPSVYWSTEVESASGSLISVVAASPNQMGPTATAVLTSKLILRFRPRLVGMVGIAAGAKSASQNYGDVLLADRTFAHDSGKRQLVDGKLMFLPDPQPLEVAPNLLARLRQWTSKLHAAELAEIRAAFPGAPDTVLKVYLGPMASGSAVIDEPSSVDDIRSHWRKLIGLEMEAYSAHRACNDTVMPATPFLCMKSVCDFAHQKSDDWQEYAAHTSSSLFMRFIKAEWDSLFPRYDVQRIELIYAGQRSLLMARALEEWVPRVLPDVHLVAVDAEQRATQPDADAARPSHTALLCVTPENATSDALLYSAGLMSERLGRDNVIALLMGLDPSDLPPAARHLPTSLLEPSDVAKLLARFERGLARKPGEEPIADRVSRRWSELEARVKRLLSQKLSEDTIPAIVRAFAKNGLPSPALGQIAFFESGFESHSIYATACTMADSRLLIFGRKNRKLFDKERREFFERLKGRVESGFDFRCLFLDPDAPTHVLDAAHEDVTFKADLSGSIEVARRELLRCGLDPRNHFRVYAFARTKASVIVDDAILSTPIHLGADGRAVRLTRCGFSAVSTNTPLGAQTVKEFNSVWQNARPLPPLVS